MAADRMDGEQIMFEELGRIANRSGEDTEAFAKDLQQLASGGGFNPFSLLAGDIRPRAVLVVPVSPHVRRAIDHYLTDGTGPLQQTVAEMQQQAGISATDAAARAHLLFSQLRHLCVLVLGHEQGLNALPQVLPSFDPALLREMGDTMAEHFPDREAARSLFAHLAQTIQEGAEFPHSFAAVSGELDALVFWSELTADLVAGLDEGIMAGAMQQQADLGYWCMRALQHCYQHEEWDGEDLLHAARCALLAGELDSALALSDALLTDFEPEDEQLVLLLQHLATTAVRQGSGATAAAAMQRWGPHCDAIIGGPCYEIQLARFRCLASSLASGDDLIAAAEALAAADRKSFRHDLGREPLWQVTVTDPGPLLDTGAAAELLDRSPSFVSKRLEQGRLPCFFDGKELRLPERGLRAWQAVMAHFQLLE